jgi:uncharacterized protein YbjT (DUF2867 family)
MSQRVFVTGGSGFVGSAVIEQLLSCDFGVHALVNRQRALLDQRIRTFPGNLFDPESLERGMKGCNAVIHLVGIIQEKPSKGVTFERVHHQGTINVVDAAKRAGVKRIIHMSALGVRADAVSQYHRTKYLAEQYVRQSGLDWTIVRPSLIHGPNGEFMHLAAKWARRQAPPFLFMPYFGAGLLGRGGAGKLQPIYVGDIARIFVECLTNPRTVGEVFLVGGPDQYTWAQLHRAIATAVVGKPRPVAPLPAWYAKMLTSIVPPALLPFNRDQVVMSQEDNTCDLSKFKADFGWDLALFEPTLRNYASRL